MVNSFDILQAGLAQFVYHPLPLIGMTILGVFYGIAFGVIPGVSSAVAMLSLIPVAFVMPITNSLVLFSAIYCGATFGGSFSAILLNIPGGPENVATSFDGYPMAKQGLAGKAMDAAITCSAIGGLIGALAFIFVAPYLANFALTLKNADYFGIVVMGLLVVGSISGRSLNNGLISVALGLIVGSIGITVQTGEERFTFGFNVLTAGVTFVSVMVGTFALGEIFLQFSKVLQSKSERTVGKYADSRFTLKELLAQKVNIIRSSIIGTIAGFIPGIGTTLASFASYGLAKSVSKTPERYGSGILDGVVAPETSNNAATGGALIPLFTLGIPGGAATAVMLAVFLSQGLQPGPLIFFKQLPMVGAVMISLLLANLLILFGGRYSAAVLIQGLRLNLVYVVTIVAVFCAVGTFSLRQMMIDPYIACIAGVLAFYWKVYDFPAAPFILGVVLGPMAENRFMNAMLQQENNIIGVLTSPVGLIFMLFGMAFIIGPQIQKLRSAKGGGDEGEDSLFSIYGLLMYVILIVASIFLWIQLDAITVLEDRISAAAWPRFALTIIVVCSVICIVQWGLRYRELARRKVKINVSLYRYLAPFGIYTFIPFVLFGGYYLLINIVGFPILTLLFAAVTLYIGGVRRLRILCIVSILLTVIVCILFIGFMKLYMPEGISWFADVHHVVYDLFFRIF